MFTCSQPAPIITAWKTTITAARCARVHFRPIVEIKDFAQGPVGWSAVSSFLIRLHRLRNKSASALKPYVANGMNKPAFLVWQYISDRPAGSCPSRLCVCPRGDRTGRLQRLALQSALRRPTGRLEARSRVLSDPGRFDQSNGAKVRDNLLHSDRLSEV